MHRRQILKLLAASVPAALSMGRVYAGQSVSSIKPVPGRWSVEQIQSWYSKVPWLVGANYLPSEKINTIDMWQVSTWDASAIAKELKLAHSLGYNTLRVFLHPLVWEDDEKGLFQRMDQFLNICKNVEIRPSFVFFDDCHYPYATLGPQPLPVPAFHNSGWVNSPTRELAERYASGDANNDEIAMLKGYVQRTISRFASDDRVLYWELYNEPGRGNGEYDQNGQLVLAKIGDRSQYLVQDSWIWAREVAPSQPITSTCLGGIGTTNSAINAANSDLYSLHIYEGFSELKKIVDAWSDKKRPVLVTEWLNRSTATDIPKEILAQLGDAEWLKYADGTNIPKYVLPYLKEKNIGAINWGFITGKSATNWHWSSRYENGKYRNLAAEREAGNVIRRTEQYPEPITWFHDLFRPDHTPHNSEEINLFKALTAAPRSWPK